MKILVAQCMHDSVNCTKTTVFSQLDLYLKGLLYKTILDRYPFEHTTAMPPMRSHGHTMIFFQILIIM